MIFTPFAVTAASGWTSPRRSAASALAAVARSAFVAAVMSPATRLAIRTDEVNAAVSPVSAVAEVRARLLEEQRRVIGEGGIVVEGRDIGTVVWPQAEVKVYLTADPAARADRRAAEAGGDVSATRASLLERDRIDSSRATAPLSKAEDAVWIDTTDYTLEEVIGLVCELAEHAAAHAEVEP